MKKITACLACILALLITGVPVTSCNKENDPATGPVTNPPVDVKLGDTYQGGIIFYLDATGKHGLIAATTDQSPSDRWMNGTFLTTGATSATDGAGNTTKIIQVQGNTGVYAAKLCRDYRGGEKTDWYLPAKDELKMLYNQKGLVGGFSNQIYWSSTEYEFGSAWVQDFTDGQQHLDNTSDGANVHTRAIRAF